jgi:hypothetical protein
MSSPPVSDEFFVGYLATPPATARRMRWVITGLVLEAAAVAAILAVSTGPFDRAKFEYGQPHEFRGMIQASPVPVLITEEGNERLPLVAQGKHGAGPLVASFDGVAVRLSATRIIRESTTMLEVVPGSIARGDTPAAASPEGEGRRGTFTGEIVDSKCFLGVMNPGRLEVHRACARRCIAGGIPPMLFGHDEQGHELHLVLVDSSGGAINDRVANLVGYQVEIDGSVVRRDGLDYLCVSTISRSN